MAYLPLYISAFSVTALLIYVFKNHAARIGLIDRPCDRKRHCGEVPLIGGLAIFSAFLISLFASGLSVSQYSAMLAGCAVLVLVGVRDDIKALPSGPRFLAQITAGVLMCVWGGVVLRDLGVLSFDGSLFTLGSLAVPFTIFATVGVINAINMSDGIDGLCGSLTLVALTGLAAATYVAGASEAFTMISILMSAVVAFLFFNIRFPKRLRALVFLGDAGSMFLGFALSWFVVSLSQGESRIITPTTALWLLAMPLFDTVGIMIRRMLKGRSPFAADREHFHHAFQLAGFSVFRTQVTITALAVIFMVLGLVGQFAGVAEIAMFYLFLGVFGLYFWGMMRAWKVMRFLRRAMHLERDASQEVMPPAEVTHFRDGHVEDLRAYYLKHRTEHVSGAQEEQSSRVELKLVVNADNSPKSDSSTSSSTPES